MKAILLLELRGLSEQATGLARELDHMGVTAERVRAATLEVVRAAAAAAAKKHKPDLDGEQGADTYYWTFPTVDFAVRFASLLLADLWQKAERQGLYYVKPAMALGWCEPRFNNGRFIDSDSIEVYKVADGGRAFTLYLVDAAVERTTYPFTSPNERARKCDATVRPLAWQTAAKGEEIDGAAVTIPTLLLDSDVAYSDTAEMAIGVVLREQAASKAVLVFGGPPSFKDPLFVNYVKESVQLIRDGGNGCKFAIISYLPINDPIASRTWLELCHRLGNECPASFRFSAFLIGQGQLRPFSYQVFDKSRVHVGLRGYSPFRSTPTLSSAILLRNSRIAQLFASDFDQSFQSVGQLDADRHHKLVGGLELQDDVAKQQVETTVRALLA